MTSHGLSKHPLYNTWATMMHRCYNPKRKDYHRYGGRGIKVAKRWHDVANFIADMGERPDGMTLERKRTNGNYTPSNCVWLDMRGQQRNRRDSRRITWRGETRCLKEWADILGIPHTALHQRIVAYGWPVERALTTPVRSYQSKEFQSVPHP